MKIRKKCFSALLTAVAALCLSALLCFFGEKVPTYASIDGRGTVTEGMWQDGQTQNLIPQIQADDTWDTLTAKGWGKDSGTPDLHVTNETDGHGYGIRPSERGSGADIGNDDFTGGIYYTIYLSDADRNKADLGQLSVSASAWYYLQASTTYHISVRAEFHTADGADISLSSTSVSKYLSGVRDSCTQLVFEQTAVPSGTSYIEMWFSNSKNLNDRPWIADMQCYLHDATAPSFEEAMLDKTGVIEPEKNIAIGGETVKVFLRFNEKVSVLESGTANLAMDGRQFLTSDAVETVESGGKTSVGYIFTLPESDDSGSLSLSSVSGLKVEDEAGNEFVYSGSPSAGSLTYYGTMTVTQELSNLETGGEQTAKYGTDYTATLRADEGYELPSSVSVSVGGVPIAEKGYTYDPNVGTLTVYGAYITDDILIKASGVPKVSQITFDRQSGSGGTGSVAAVYDAGLPDIAAPSRTGYAFAGYYSQSGGKGTKYYDESGKGVRNCDFDAPITLYAHWVANGYFIEFDGNEPSEASGKVSGDTPAAERTYDDGEISLPLNGFALTGWTFCGWAESKNGTVVYADGQAVQNLTDEEAGRVVLYAVWEANTYAVKYASNKPVGASAEVVGETMASSHVYDAESALTKNGFSLAGWTFCGWGESENGAVVYADEQEVQNLTAENGGTVTLYAVWKAKEYTFMLNAMGGSNSGSGKATYDSVLPELAVIPVRYGYIFLGYFDAKEGGTQYFGEDGKAFEGKTFTVEDNIVLYAQWTPVAYTIELYSQGRYLGAMEGVAFGELKLPSAQALSLERENFDFVGWNTYDEQDWAMYNADTVYATGLTGEQDDVVVLYAAWLEKPLHSLAFDANGGIGAPAMMQVHEEESVVLSNSVPSRENYTFLGWALSADSEIVQYRPGGEFTMGSAGVTLYAVWEHNPSLSYDANGGAFVVSVEVSYPAVGETVVVASHTPELEGYVFEGWSTERDATAATYRAGETFAMPGSDTVLYAVWERAQYAVTSDAAGGYQIAGLQEKYYHGETASFRVAGASPKVYVNGQLVAAGQDGQYSFVVRGEAHVFVADGSKCSLIYSANGGTGAPSDHAAYDAGSAAQISAEEPERAGYTFLGWSSDQNAESAEYAAGGTIVFAGEDVVLYAVWRANTYAVVYRANGGAGSMASDVFRYGTAGTLSRNAFEKEGNRFIGWALSEEGDVVYRDGANVSDLCAEDNGIVTLYAVWERSVTVISFVLEEGGEVSDSVAIAYGERLSSDGLAVPLRVGYRFGGYFTQPNGAGEMLFDAKLQAVLAGAWDRDVGALTLYAHWTPVSYTVAYMNGSEMFGEQSAEYGTAFSLKSAETLGIVASEGYRFAGWTVFPSGQVAVYADEQTIFDALTRTDGETIYLYAVFKANEAFSVTYDANGGSDAPIDTRAYFAGETVWVSDVIPEREGYLFGGWSSDPNGNLIEFPFEDGRFAVDSVAMPEGGMALYAVWIAGDTLQAQIDRLEDRATSLAEAIDALENADQTFAEELEELRAMLREAQAAIAALDDVYATDAELAAAADQIRALLKQAETELEGQIASVQANLEQAVKDLNASIAANKSDVEEKLAALENAYKAADALIESELSVLQAQDGALAERLSALESACQIADEELRQAIDSVQENLEQTAEDLNNSIAANKSDVEEKLAALENAYKAADALIESELSVLQAQDGAFTERLSALESACQIADEELRQAIDSVQINLNQAVKDLTDSIAANKSDVEEKLAALENAYKAADALIESELSVLQAQDGVLAERLSALEASYRVADEALWAGIRQIQENLDALQQLLEGKDSALENKLNALIAEYEKTTLAHRIVDIILVIAVTALIAALIVGGMKKRNSKK